MPVIQLPKDTRWGDLGNALGGAVTKIVDAYSQQQAQQDIMGALQDPDLNDAGKQKEMLKRAAKYPNGLELVGKLLKAQEMQAQIAGTQARTGLTQAQTGLTGAETTTIQAKAPYVAPQAAATVAGTQAGTAEKQAATETEKALLGPRVAKAGADVALTTEKTGTQANETEKLGLENQLLQTQLDLMKSSTSGDVSGASSILERSLDAMGIKKPEDRAVAINAYTMEPNPLKKGDAFATTARQIRTSERSAEIQRSKPTEAETKFAAQAEEHAVSAERFLKAFKEGGAQKQGFFNGANVKTFLERWGIPVGDPTVLEMWNASAQQVQSTATSGGGFYAEGRKKLAESVTPGIAESPLHAIIAADQVSDRQLAQIESRLKNYPEDKALRSARDRWADVKKITGSLDTWDTARKTPVVMFDGAWVDAKTFKPIMQGNSSLKIHGNDSINGITLFQLAKQAKATPQEILERLRAGQ